MMSGAEVKIMEKILIELIVYIALPFNIPERPSFWRFVESIQLHGSKSLPGRTKTKVNLLVNRAIIAVSSMEELIATNFQRGHRAGMAIDGWSNVHHVHIRPTVNYHTSSMLPLKSSSNQLFH